MRNINSFFSSFLPSFKYHMEKIIIKKVNYLLHICLLLSSKLDNLDFTIILLINFRKDDIYKLHHCCITLNSTQIRWLGRVFAFTTAYTIYLYLYSCFITDVSQLSVRHHTGYHVYILRFEGYK